MNSNPYISWEEVRNKINISKEQEAEIQLEKDIIEATIQIRKNNKLTQRELSMKSGIKQPVIARIEKCTNSPQTNTLIRLLYPMGYTIRVVPLEEVKEGYSNN
jgi:predicted XRE-type DNA-binding protein